MDTKIALGDLALGDNGLLQEVCCLDECLQQVYIALSVKQGTLIYNEDFGSKELVEAEENPENYLIALGNQGLINLNCEITAVEIEENEYIFTVKTPYGEGTVNISKGGD